MTATVNLHEQRRRSTREALRRAALASFARKGFANVTVTELAREAGVTERTFFRHFPTKEAVLFQDYETQVEWLAEALAQRPASESLFDAVLASVASFPHDLEVVRQAATARTELISADRIANHLLVVQSSFAGVITDFIKERYSEKADIDLVAEVAGAALAAALVAAVENWGRNGCRGDLGEITAAAVNLVRSGMAPLSS
jgi:AcrR family transcriptional regulator